MSKKSSCQMLPFLGLLPFPLHTIPRQFSFFFSSISHVNIMLTLCFHPGPELHHRGHNMISMVLTMQIKFASVATLVVVKKMLNILTEAANMRLILLLRVGFLLVFIFFPLAFKSVHPYVWLYRTDGN